MAKLELIIISCVESYEGHIHSISISCFRAVREHECFPKTVSYYSSFEIVGWRLYYVRYECAILRVVMNSC